jgi:hypothetical protein
LVSTFEKFDDDSTLNGEKERKALKRIDPLSVCLSVCPLK